MGLVEHKEVLGLKRRAVCSQPKIHIHAKRWLSNVDLRFGTKLTTSDEAVAADFIKCVEKCGYELSNSD